MRFFLKSDLVLKRSNPGSFKDSINFGVTKKFPPTLHKICQMRFWVKIAKLLKIPSEWYSYVHVDAYICIEFVFEHFRTTGKCRSNINFNRSAHFLGTSWHQIEQPDLSRCCETSFFKSSTHLCQALGILRFTFTSQALGNPSPRVVLRTVSQRMDTAVVSASAFF